MKQEEKLQKIIAKAESNGFEEKFYVWAKVMGNNEWTAIIFDHDFCKAYFGEEEPEFYPGDDLYAENNQAIYWEEPVWKYHLQQLAITPPEERINYLYKKL